MNGQNDTDADKAGQLDILLNRRSLLVGSAALAVASSATARVSGVAMAAPLRSEAVEATVGPALDANMSFSRSGSGALSARLPGSQKMPAPLAIVSDPHAIEGYIKSLVDKFLSQISTRSTEDIILSFVHNDLLRSACRHELFSTVPNDAHGNEIYNFFGEEFIPDDPTRYVILDNSAYNPTPPPVSDAKAMEMQWPEVMVSATILSRWTERVTCPPVGSGAASSSSPVPLTGIYRLSLIWVRQHPEPDDPLGPLAYKIANIHLSPWKGQLASTINYQKPAAVKARPFLPQVTHRTHRRPTLSDRSFRYPTPLNSPRPGGGPVHHWPSETFIRDAIALHFGRAQNSLWWIFDGWETDIEGWGTKNNPVNMLHMLGESANLVETAEHYNGLFGSFAPDFDLVSDNAIVAGPYFIQSYHAAARVVVDKAAAVGYGEKQIIFHGQTIYEISRSGKIRWRWSNHYNEIWSSQLQYWIKEHKNPIIRDWFPDPFFLIENSSIKPIASERDPASVSELYIRDTMFRIFGEFRRGRKSRPVDQRVLEIKEFVEQYFRNEAFESFYTYPNKKVIDPSDPMDPKSDLVRVDSLYNEMSLFGRFLNNLIMYDDSYAVIDEIVVCGNYAGIKYHQSFKTDANANSWKLIRGQAIFEFWNDESGLIKRAWDNPDEYS
jgi:hypothetical protein